MSVTFFQPAWLLLIVPLAAAWFAWPLPNRALRISRAALFVLVVLAIAQLAVRLPDRAGTVVVVVDRSESMPKNAPATQKEIIDLLQRSMKPRDQLGVVSFGRQAIVEQAPQHSAFGGFTADIGAEHSDLDNAIETALTLIPPDAGGRILVISDGRWTGRDPAHAAARAAGRGIPIDYRQLARPQAADVAIQSFLTPQAVQPGQAYLVSGWIRSAVDQDVQYQLRRGSTVIASGTKQVSAGLTRLMFRDRASEAGIADYTLVVDSGAIDPVPENNQARALVSIEGTRPILVVSAAGANSGLANLLQRGGVDVIARFPQQNNWALEELAQYSAVIVENVPAMHIGSAGMEAMALWVEESGGGLMMTGGQKSYGPGGYFKSPLDRILPVSMEMRKEHRKMTLAIVVALDRSGSMSAPAGGGRIKMDLANIGTAQVLDLLSPMDELGVFAVDTQPHLIVPLDYVEKNRAARGHILAIGSQGGGINVFEALEAASRTILNANSQSRHIILFADAADSRQHPGDYPTLIAKCREAEITISVIGLGTERDPDADILKDVALRGGGTCYFTANADEIPQLFAQDTFTVARSTFVDQPTEFDMTPGFSLLGGSFGPAPPLGGYNLFYIRPEANLAAITKDEFIAPVVASWIAGNGRVLCYAGEADGKFSGPLASWDQVGDMFATLARWTAGKRGALPEGQMLTEEVRDGICFVQLHLDPNRAVDPFVSMPRVKVLHGTAGSSPARRTVSFEWKTADLLEAAIPIMGRETVLNTVEIPGQEAVTLAPVCLPYSPEFAPDQQGRGVAALAQLAVTSGGTERIELPGIWQDLQPKLRYIELTPWLLVMAVSLFLLEIFERRTGWLTRAFGGKSKSAMVVVADETIDEPVATPSRSRRSSASQTAPAPKTPAKKNAPDPPVQSTDSATDALRKARERAGRRTKRD